MHSKLKADNSNVVNYSMKKMGNVRLIYIKRFLSLYFWGEKTDFVKQVIAAGT